MAGSILASSPAQGKDIGLRANSPGGQPKEFSVPYPLSATRDVIIRTERFEDAVRFYESVLGLKIVQRSESLVGFDAGAFRLYVEHGPAHGPVFDFLAANFRAARAALLAAGCTIQEEDTSVPRCYLRDPYGLVFNIDQRRAAS
jgi:predicted enzyme related to lactoylglutathione lyase